MKLEELVHAAARGDQRAWVLLADRLYPKLLKFFAVRCAGFDCKDLVQETLSVVGTKLPAFEMHSEAAFHSWVFQIAQFRALKARDNRGHADELAKALGRVQRTPSPRVSSLLDRAERLEIVMREIEKLPASQRRAIQDMLDDVDPKELAKRLGISRGSIRSARSRALAELRERLRPSTPSS